MASTYTNLLYHVVFSTKHRRPMITPSLETELYKYVGGIVRGEEGKLLEIGGMPDHVHLIARFKADVSVATMLRAVKAGSSKWINERTDHATPRFAWQTGYAAFSVSESQVDAAKAYVRNQKQHHAKLSFRDELVALLQRHGIEYDDRFLLD